MKTLRRLLIVSSAALLAVAALVTANPASAARSPVRAGLGFRVAGGDFVGFYLTAGGSKVYCLDPDKSAPRSISLGSVERYPGVSRVVTAELSYALTQWGDATSRAAAAVESQVLNTLVGNDSDVHRRASEIPAQLRVRVAAHLRQTRALTGPYSLSVGLPKQLGVGQTARGSVRVTTAAGRPVPNIGIVVSHTANSTASDWTRTNRHGIAHFTYSVTDVGPVHIGATAVALPAGGILTSHPGAGQQHLVAWQHRVTVHASASFERAANGMTASYACSTTCNGHPTLTLRACAEPSRVTSKLTYRVGSTTKTVVYAPSRIRHCQTASVVASDGNRVSAQWQYRVGHHWSRPVAAPGSMTVDCPAVPAVAVTMTYDCSRAEVVVALAASGTSQPLVNMSQHRLVLVISGVKNRRVYAGHGRSAVFSASASCDSPVTYRARAGVQRDNGRYNYGPVASVTTPGASD